MGRSLAELVGCVLALGLVVSGCNMSAPAPDRRTAAVDLPPHPLMLQLDEALAAEDDPARADLIRRNLARLAQEPMPRGRHVLVDAAGQRLYLFDGNRLQGSMPVIVGSATDPTPLLNSQIVRLVARPYWNVPLDLAQRRTARHVLRHGTKWLTAQGMETLDPSQQAPRPIPASSIDWRKVAAGRAEARIRQRPGRANMMGAMKFELPNSGGIYLHDTPEKALFAKADRALSAGCIRVSDWKMLASWLWGGPPPGQSPNDTTPEQRFDLPDPVPIRVVYLTLSPLGPNGWLPPGTLAAQADPYRLETGQTADARSASTTG